MANCARRTLWLITSFVCLYLNHKLAFYSVHGKNETVVVKYDIINIEKGKTVTVGIKHVKSLVQSTAILNKNFTLIF